MSTAVRGQGWVVTEAFGNGGTVLSGEERLNRHEAKSKTWIETRMH